jgi:hypothetical protein
MKKILLRAKGIFTRKAGRPLPFFRLPGILLLGLVLSTCQGPLDGSQSPSAEAGRDLAPNMSGSSQSLPKPPVRPAGIDYYPGMKLVYLSWFPSARAETYDVYYSTGTDFDTAEQFEPAEDITEPKAKVTGLEDKTVYNFWVKAKNQGGATLSRMFRGSWPTSDPMPPQLFYRGSTETVFTATNGGGDSYKFVDLGEGYAPDELYKFAYSFFGDPDGSIHYLKDGVLIFQYVGQYGSGSMNGKFDATYGASPTTEWPYSAPMGQANSYGSGLPGTSGQYGQPVTTLEEAIKKFTPLPNPGNKGGSRYYISGMDVRYQIVGNP